MHRLRVKSGMINPFWINGLCYENKGMAINEKEIEVDKEILVVVDESVRLQSGQIVYVYADRYFYFETEEEKRAREERIRLEKDEKRRKEKLNCPSLLLPGSASFHSTPILKAYMHQAHLPSTSGTNHILMKH